MNLSAYDKLIWRDHMIRIAGKDGSFGGRILDASMNSGLFAVGLAKNNAEVTLVDTSRQKLDAAEERMYQSECYNGIYVQAQVTDLSLLDDCSYDAVICCGNLFNALSPADAETALRELKRVTKIGGCVTVSALSRGGVLRQLARNGEQRESGENARLIEQLIATGKKFPDKPDALFYHTAETLGDLFRACCFMNVTVGAIPSLVAGMREEINAMDPLSDDYDNLLRAEQLAAEGLMNADSGDFVVARGVRV